MTTRGFAGVLLAVFLLAGDAGAGILTKRIQFEHPTVMNARGGVVLAVAGCRSIGYPGEPILPVYPARFIIPHGETVSRVIVEAEQTVTLAGSYMVAPMQPQAPFGAPAPVGSQALVGSRAPQSLVKNESLYRSAEQYPSERGVLVTEQVVSGIRLAFVSVYPCAIIPASNTVLFSPSLRVTIETASAPGAPIRVPAAQAERAARRLAPRVQNPECAVNYAASALSPSDTVPPPELAEYVVITSPPFAPFFQPLIDLKNSCGVRARTVDTEWIAANFGGLDTQEKIRNFITFAHENWQTRYVLLGGDNEIIPHRGLYAKVGTVIDADIPSDLYYACLDGTWNTDGDQYFGEPGEEDLLPEVIVGRLPVDSPAEIGNVVQKISSYTLSPVASQCASSLMLGELLWSNGGVNTWGGDYKNEIRYGSSNYGFTTAGIPSDFATTTLYDSEGFSWNKGALIPILNGGVHLVNHCGHSNPFSVMRLAIGDVPLLTNDGTEASFFICYSQGCYAASFDNRDAAGAIHAEDCIGEELLTGPHGAVAFIGNTRLGWDAPGSSCGVSQFFDRQFFDAIFGEGIVKLGDALEDSRFDNISYMPYDAVRWVYYGMCLLGDPALAIWTGAPRELVAAHDSVLYEGQQGFGISVSDENGPVAGAIACLNSTAPDVYCSAVTDDAGAALLEPSAPGGTNLLLSILSPNHYPHTDTVHVDMPSDHLPSLTIVGVDDDGVGRSSGDGDGTVEAGETVELAILLRNIGREALGHVEISLASPDSLLVIGDGSYFAGDLAAGASSLIDSAFSIAVRSTAPNGYRAPIEFSVTSDEGSWRTPQTLDISAPDVTLESWTLTDSVAGNGNGCLETWEFQNLACVYRNRGTAEVLAPVLTLSFPDDSWGKTTKGTVEASVIPAGGTVSFPANLQWFVNETAPPFSEIHMILRLDAQNMPAHTETLTVQTCGYALADTVGAEGPFHHEAIIGVDQWHVSTARSHSAPASWRCGNPSGGVYANMTESILALPPFCLFSQSTMTFWHRMNAEAGSTYPYWALDAGVVEISQDDGRTWSIVTPAGSYPSRASPYNTIFLASYQRCYSGTFDWRRETFDLSSYHGPIRLRFHFASDEQYGYEGWYVDDINVTTSVPTDVDGGDTPRFAWINALEPAYPNPFNPSSIIPFEIASKGRVEMKIFDVSGRLIRTLLGGIFEAGRHTARWDGTDGRGRPAASGVYFCRLETGAYTATARLVLLR